MLSYPRFRVGFCLKTAFCEQLPSPDGGTSGPWQEIGAREPRFGERGYRFSTKPKAVLSPEKTGGLLAVWGILHFCGLGTTLEQDGPNEAVGRIAAGRVAVLRGMKRPATILVEECNAARFQVMLLTARSTAGMRPRSAGQRCRDGR